MIVIQQCTKYMIKILKQLSSKDLAVIYLQLGRLENSGIPIQQALLMLIKTGGEVGKRLKKMLLYIQHGHSLCQAGTKAGLFVGLDIALVDAAESGGTTAEVFRQMAQFYEEKARQYQRIKSGLILPGMVFLLAIFIQPFPDLFLGKITLISYLFTTVGFIIQLAIVIFIFLQLPNWIRYGFLQPWVSVWDKIEIKMPYFGYWGVRQSLRDFMRLLGLMVQAGVPILDALPKVYEVVENSVLRKELQQISLYLEEGESFAESCSQVEGMNTVAIQLISIGEHAGSLDQMMLHYAKLESEDIALHHKMLADWIPRVVYSIICIWMIYGILSAGPPMSKIPEF